MKINGTIFSKPQQDQLKRAIENAIENIDSGTTLNKYEYTSTNSQDTIKRAMRILNTAKSIAAFDFNGLATTMPSKQANYRMNVSGFGFENNTQVIYNITLDRADGQLHSADHKVTLSNEGITITQPTINTNIHIIYYNDTEII